jgi:hypothetical protein
MSRPPPEAYGALGPPTPPFETGPADESLAPACATTPPRASAPINTAIATVTPGERVADRAGLRPWTRRAVAPSTITAFQGGGQASGNRREECRRRTRPPDGRPSWTRSRWPALPGCQRRPAPATTAEALARATAPQTSCAAATTAKNARFWGLSRPRVAAAAMWMAPVAMPARAIADSARAGFRSGSALEVLRGTGPAEERVRCVPIAAV